MAKENLVGKRFKRLVVISESPIKSGRKTYWNCLCDCGNETVVRADLLKSGNTKSCGCLSKDKAKLHLENLRFGYLTVICENGRTNRGDVLWRCKCDCGNIILVKSVNLSHGYVKSCGCMTTNMIREKNSGHGLCDTKLYSVWGGMKSRCYDSKNREYNNYGGRGINVCEEWKKDFVSFYTWAINNGFRDDLTIDRIDNNKGYSPDNCRWITNREQQRNKRNTIYLTYGGIEKSLSEWSEVTGISRSTIKSRMKLGWTVEEALETPVGTRIKRKANVSA